MGNPGRLLSLLADEHQLKTVGWIALNGSLTETDHDQCAQEVGVERRLLDRMLVRLVSGGLLKYKDRTYTVEYGRPGAVVALLDEADVITRQLQGDFQALQGFFVHGELVESPTKPAKVRALADLLAHLFNPGREYSEAQVNNILTLVNDDYLSLRRLLVDNGHLRRTQDGRTYWRTEAD